MPIYLAGPDSDLPVQIQSAQALQRHFDAITANARASMCEIDIIPYQISLHFLAKNAYKIRSHIHSSS